MKEPKNANYAGVVVEVKNLITIENADRLAHVNFFGNIVIVSKDTEIGSRGIFFPLETALSKEFLSNNNLYRKGDLNKDKEKKGFFEENGRIKAVKLRGAKSMGFFIPLESLSYTGFDVSSFELGDTFDELKGHEICKKYVNKVKRTEGSGNNKNQKKKEKVSMLVSGQFNFHYDTSQLGRNIHMINPDDTISITKKLHRTSLVSSKVLCKKKLSFWNAIGKALGFDVKDTEYKNVYSSRRVVKNDDMKPTKNHFYTQDIWGLANDQLKDLLSDGMSVYAEIVGYLPDGGYIQKGYDYGCAINTFDVYVYRITYTNSSNQVYEFTAKQVQSWCKANGVKAVPELFYGKASGFDTPYDEEHQELEEWRDCLLKDLSDFYLEQDCSICDNNVPDEGIVLKVENKLDVPAYKLKSFKFYQHESKQLDSGEENIEDSDQE